MYKVTLPAPLTVNDKEISELVLTRAPTAEDLGNHSIYDLIIEQKPEVVAHVISRISDPFIPAEAITKGGAVNLMPMGAALNAFLEQFAGVGKVEKLDQIPTSAPSAKGKK